MSFEWWPLAKSYQLWGQDVKVIEFIESIEFVEWHGREYNSHNAIDSTNWMGVRGWIFS